MDPEIKKSIRKLFVKFLLFQAVIFAAAVLLSVLFTSYYKGRLGRQLASASRDSLLSGDARHIITTLPASMSRDFSGMSWVPAGEEKGFSVPAAAGAGSLLVYALTRIPLYFDDGNKFAAGAMVFYYPRWTPVLWGLLAWLVMALLSLPVALLERRRLIRDYNLLLELRIKESYSTLAAQVAHDIRSPLAALGAASKSLELPRDQRTMIDGSIGRIQGIADDLLARYRAPGAVVTAKMETCALAGLIEQVLAEKRIQHKDRAGVSIEFNGGSQGLKAAVDPKELQRIISNLVNNSVEAFAGPGEVRVGLAVSEGKILIEIRDNGKGIPPEILARLGQKGETHGKTGGTGLGLYHARTSVEGWGGALEIISEPGRGTAVRIALPAAARPAAGLRAALLDDDPLVHMNWRMAAKAAGAELKAYKTPEEFTAAAATLPRDIPLYIDSELGNGIKGEDIAKDLHDKGFTDISMATGHGAEKFTHLPWLKVTGKEPPWA